MWLLEESLKGVSTATVFQTFELLSCWETVYQGEIDEELGWCALALAVKFRESEFHLFDQPHLLTREAELFAAGLANNAFTTVYDQVTQLVHTQKDPIVNCCAELALFKTLNWSAEQIVAAAEQWKQGVKPLASDEIAARIAKKFGLLL